MRKPLFVLTTMSALLAASASVAWANHNKPPVRASDLLLVTRCLTEEGSARDLSDYIIKIDADDRMVGLKLIYIGSSLGHDTYFVLDRKTGQCTAGGGQ